ncbi:MAG: hypothetical protein AAFQ43_03590 [Bacteroidota bacterium]
MRDAADYGRASGGFAHAPGFRESASGARRPGWASPEASGGRLEAPSPTAACSESPPCSSFSPW